MTQLPALGHEMPKPEVKLCGSSAVLHDPPRSAEVINGAPPPLLGLGPSAIQDVADAHVTLWRVAVLAGSVSSCQD
jgi:hypothetical protein